jgi:hypothetical protein
MNDVMKNRISHFVLIVCLAGLVFSPGVSLSRAQDASPQEQGGGMGMGDLAAHSLRGTVTAVTGNQISVKTEEGDAWKIATGPNTRFRKDRQEIKAADIHTGDIVVAAGDRDDKAKTVGAIFVAVLDRAQYEKARADFGKTWTSGKVVSMKDLTITIERPDKVTQTIAVDENTSFRKRRDSITLADIKVGDNLTARGALQGGNFLATTLTVMEPGQAEPGQMGPGRGGRSGRGSGDSGTNTGTNPGTGSGTGPAASPATTPPPAAQPQPQ